MFRTVSPKILAIFSLFLSLMGCNLDPGISPLPATLGVDVVFLSEKMPENTEGVYLFVAPKFPPHAINELYLSPNSLPLNQDTIYTEIYLPFGHYEAIGLWWYNKETASNLADIFTLKTAFDPRTFEWSLYEFDLTEEKPYHRVLLPANANRVERDATIKGTIYFNGPFPENTLVTAIAAYIQKPVADIEYFMFLKSMDFSIDKNPYHFTLPVDSRTDVNYLAVFWLPERAGLGEFRTLGFYQDENGNPLSIPLSPGETVTGIEIYADWNRIHEK